MSQNIKPINKLVIDSTQAITELCVLGAQHRTDKSPLSSPLAKIVENPIDYAHGYTAIYDFLFSNIAKASCCVNGVFVSFSYCFFCSL